MSDVEKVKKLRVATGAGFKDCNLAIKEAKLKDRKVDNNSGDDDSSSKKQRTRKRLEGAEGSESKNLKHIWFFEKSTAFL